MDLNNLLNSPEGKTLEFKRDTSSLKQIMRTIVAFANTAGGILIIGRKDNGEVIGVDDPLMMEEQLSNAIADSISPMLIPDIEIASLSGKSLLRIRVAHWPGPFHIKAEGPEHGVYIRLGSTNRKAGPEFIAEIRRQHQAKSFDQLPCPDYGAEALDIPFIQKTFATIGRPAEEKHLISLGVLACFGGRNVPTHGGLILFGKPDIRQQVLPDARVSCARFAGSNKADFIDRLDFEGSIVDVIEQVPLFVRRHTRLFPKISGMKRVDIPAYSPAVIREILVNSVVHCDYSLMGMRVMVAIYADRMEIQSPGILPFGMTIEDFKEGLSKIRNRVIARTFRELGLMEEWGSGYKRIVDICQENGYPIPEWNEIGPSLRVTIYPHPEAREAVTPPATPPAAPPVTPPVEKILLMCENPRSREEIQYKIGIKNKKHFLDTYLKPAIKSGYLEMTIPEKPSSPLQKYRLTVLGKQWLANKLTGE